MSIERAAVDVAKKILEGEISLLDGADTLHSLLGEITGDFYHPDFIAFSNLVDDLCHIPLGSVRDRFSEQALEKMNKEQSIIEERHHDCIVTTCHRVIERYGKEYT
jgi:hypothetical protein